MGKPLFIGLKRRYVVPYLRYLFPLVVLRKLLTVIQMEKSAKNINWIFFMLAIESFPLLPRYFTGCVRQCCAREHVVFAIDVFSLSRISYSKIEAESVQASALQPTRGIVFIPYNFYTCLFL